MSVFLRRAFNHIRWQMGLFGQKISTAFVYFIARVLSISIGKRCLFYGIPYFSISKFSNIIIGNDCVFRSKETCNAIGLYHKCMLTCSSIDDMPSNIRIGDSCGFSGTSIWCVSEITIGDNVKVGANTLIMDHDAHPEDPRTTSPAPIIIGDNAFIGANCVIKKGVTIGANSVIGMNSVVTKDIPDNCVAVGVPAKVIRQL